MASSLILHVAQHALGGAICPAFSGPLRTAAAAVLFGTVAAQVGAKIVPVS